MTAYKKRKKQYNSFINKITENRNAIWMEIMTSPHKPYNKELMERVKDIDSRLKLFKDKFFWEWKGDLERYWGKSSFRCPKCKQMTLYHYHPHIDWVSLGKEKDVMCPKCAGRSLDQFHWDQYSQESLRHYRPEYYHATLENQRWPSK